jgi:hypothetical protein
MVFSSPTFVCLFLPLTLALYFLLPRSSNNAVLVAASIVFYGRGDPVAAFALILPSIAMNFHLGRMIGRAEGARRRLSSSRRTSRAFIRSNCARMGRINRAGLMICSRGWDRRRAPPSSIRVPNCARASRVTVSRSIIRRIRTGTILVRYRVPEDRRGSCSGRPDPSAGIGDA